MIPTTIHEAPPLDSFTPLAEHQEQTPETFHGGKPILHYHTARAQAVAYRNQISKLPFFKAATNGQANGETTPLSETKVDGEATNGHVNGESADDTKITELVDIYISTSNLIIFNPTLSTGLSIPYPSITLHATQTLPDPSSLTTQTHGLYMQLNLSDPNTHDEEDDSGPEIVTLTLIPPSTPPPTSDSNSASQSIQESFNALTTCSNLNPTPQLNTSGFGDRVVFEGNIGYDGMSGLPPGVRIGNAEGGLPPPFLGSGGWITAENVSEFFDAEGNWIAGGDEEQVGLGEGAGRVRSRSEFDADGEGEEGEGDEVDEGKWRRTEE